MSHCWPRRGVAPSPPAAVVPPRSGEGAEGWPAGDPTPRVDRVGGGAEGRPTGASRCGAGGTTVPLVVPPTPWARWAGGEGLVRARPRAQYTGETALFVAGMHPLTGTAAQRRPRLCRRPVDAVRVRGARGWGRRQTPGCPVRQGRRPARAIGGTSTFARAGSRAGALGKPATCGSWGPVSACKKRGCRSVLGLLPWSAGKRRWREVRPGRAGGLMWRSRLPACKSMGSEPYVGSMGAALAALIWTGGGSRPPPRHRCNTSAANFICWCCALFAGISVSKHQGQVMLSQSATDPSAVVLVVRFP